VQLFFTFGEGSFGSIGAPSPLRQVEVWLREEGVPLYVHAAPARPIPDEPYERVKADVNDLEFLRRFQSGLKTSPAFRSLHIPPGNYGAAGDQKSLAQKLITLDLVAALKTYESPIALFEDSTIQLDRFFNSSELRQASAFPCRNVLREAKLRASH
jgi:hypothetical protein